MQYTNISADSPITPEVIDELYSYTNVLPVNANKEPLVLKWTHWQTERQEPTHILSMPWDSAHGIAMIMGFNGLECIDVDLKNDPQGTIVRDFLDKITDLGPDLLNKLYCEWTPSGGIHIVYQCNTVGRSTVLARNKEGDPIIETKGHGGYVVVAPTPGYKPFRIGKNDW